VIIEQANNASQAIWRRLVRWSRLTWVIRVVSGILVGVAALLGGGTPQAVNDAADGEDVHPSEALGTLRCGLAVKESSGWVRGIQVDFTDRLASRWQGPGVIIPGILWIGDRGLIWMPRRRVSGARGFELRRDDIERIQVSSVGVRSSGLVVTTSEHGEAWLLLHRSDAATLLTRMDGHDPLGGRADSA